MDSIESAAGSHEEKRRQQQRSQHLCNGYNIEQRECNLFECKGKRKISAFTFKPSQNPSWLSPAQYSILISTCERKDTFTRD